MRELRFRIMKFYLELRKRAIQRLTTNTWQKCMDTIHYTCTVKCINERLPLLGEHVHALTETEFGSAKKFRAYVVQEVVPVEARSVPPKFSLMNHFWHSKWGTLFTYSSFTYSYFPYFGQSLKNIKIAFLALSEYYFEYECTNRYIPGWWVD